MYCQKPHYKLFPALQPLRQPLSAFRTGGTPLAGSPH